MQGKIQYLSAEWHEPFVSDGMYSDGSGKGNFEIAKENHLKVLWICNVPIPEAKDVMGDEVEVRVSWLVGISKALRKKVDLYIGYPS